MKKILLADDEESVLALVSATLENTDRYELLLARDGEEAIRIARQEMPELLFLDIMLPKADGYDVCKTLRQDKRTDGMKIIMLTAMAQDIDRLKGIEAGADEYLTKPFSPTALLQHVEGLMAAA